MKKILSLIFLLLIICTTALADTQIGEFVITDETTPEEVISYIFQILVGLGALIAVAMVVMAGVEWMTSDGNPGKIDGAKTKIKNALLGVGVLLGSYLIINTINPQITNIKVDNLMCDTGIIVKTDKGQVMCIDGTLREIGYEIKETVNSDAWAFEPNTILKVYVYREVNFGGSYEVLDFSKKDAKYKGNISGAKSIYFVPRDNGIYLYDQEGFGSDKTRHPLFFAASVPDLSKHSFNNKTKSIQIVDNREEDNKKYSVVAFTGTNYSGRCSYIDLSRGQLEPIKGQEWTQILSPNYTCGLQNNSISSLLINLSDTEDVTKERGEVTFFTTQNCHDGATGVIGQEEVKSCTIKATGAMFISDGEVFKGDGESIEYVCEGLGVSNFRNPMSMMINGPVDVVLISDFFRDYIDKTRRYKLLNYDARCQLFRESGGCINLFSTFVLPGLKGVYPKAFMLIPRQ